MKKVHASEDAPRQASVLPERVQAALGDLLGAAREGLLALSVGVGLGVMHLRRLAAPTAPETAETTRRRAALEDRLRRARDLYEIGDLPRPEYIARRDAIHAELSTLAPQPIPDLDQARHVLEDFAIFWRNEHDPNAKRQFLSLVFDGIWLDDHRVVAVQPKPAFLPFFQNQRQKAPEPTRVNDGCDGGRTLVCCFGDRDLAV